MDKIINSHVHNLLPKYIKILQDLIKFRSIRFHEREIQNYILKILESYSLDCSIVYSREDAQSMNIYTVIKGSDPENYNSLALNAHVDIAPIEEEHLWKFPPFSGYIERNFIYGRGAKDDKAGVTILLYLIEIIKELKLKLKGNLILHFVVDDEVSGDGTKKIIEEPNHPRVDGAIIVDGTWTNRIIYAHLGQLYLDITVNSEIIMPACNVSKSDNVIKLAIAFIKEVNDYIDDLNKNYPLFEDGVIPFFVNVGSINSGLWYGSTPAYVKLQIQIGFSNALRVEEIYSSVTNIAEMISSKIKIEIASMKTNAFIANKDNKLIRIVLNKSISNQKKEVVPVAGYCDLRHFNTQNVCMYGPGKGFNNHTIDECYDLTDLPIVTNELVRICHEWCNTKRNAVYEDMK